MKKTNKIDKLMKIDVLFDLYSNTLNKTQYVVFEDYYHNDYSICEIAKKRNVSRQFISEILKSAVYEMEKTDKLLMLTKKSAKRNIIINNMLKIIENSNIADKTKSALKTQIENLLKVN